MADLNELPLGKAAWFAGSMAALITAFSLIIGLFTAPIEKDIEYMKQTLGRIETLVSRI